MEGRTVLMVALDQLANYRENILSLDMGDVRQVCHNFNENGLMVLLATADGMKVLEDPRGIENGAMDINYPLSLIQMQEDDFDSFCAVYLLASEGADMLEVETLPQLKSVIQHCRAHNKLIAVQSGHASKVLYPHMPDIEVGNLDGDERYLNDLFSSSISKLCKRRLNG